MSTDSILLFAIVVYILMAAGMTFTVQEFRRMSNKPQVRKNGSGGPLELDPE